MEPVVNGQMLSLVVAMAKLSTTELVSASMQLVQGASILMHHIALEEVLLSALAKTTHATVSPVTVSMISTERAANIRMQ